MNPNTEAKSETKRKRGPKPKTDADRRPHAVACRLTDEELALCDARRGGLSRGAWLRIGALQNLPPTVPEINREAWAELSRAAANLNQIAKRLNAAHPAGDVQLVEYLMTELAQFRSKLVGMGS